MALTFIHSGLSGSLLTDEFKVIGTEFLEALNTPLFTSWSIWNSFFFFNCLGVNWENCLSTFSYLNISTNFLEIISVTSLNETVSSYCWIETTCSSLLPQGLIKLNPFVFSLMFNENPWSVVHLLTLIPIEAIFPSLVHTPVSSVFEKASIDSSASELIITFSILRTKGTTSVSYTNLTLPTNLSV